MKLVVKTANHGKQLRFFWSLTVCALFIEGLPPAGEGRGVRVTYGGARRLSSCGCGQAARSQRFAL